jgi:hypothetical protein
MNYFTEPTPVNKVTYKLHYVSNRYESWLYSAEYDTKEGLDDNISIQKKCGNTIMKIEVITKTSKFEEVS